ncbi:hypothetical protein TNIN_169641 [Trichonephila inaurata madagascariensis]|uniref:Uncharacterized protein n=1 Tax=Trichonephila inaurata madagascariensis TaxID=2747483 RepID=A0A8X6WXX9_9ARAC|nr:hypothetical protein TNIN_169641 [Trichonephila inaurata madagascariensis]
MDPPPPTITDEQHCLHLHGPDKEIRIFAARKDCINQMLEIERGTPSPTPETTKKLEEELSMLEAKIKTLKVMSEFLPCPIDQFDRSKDLPNRPLDRLNLRRKPIKI